MIIILAASIRGLFLYLMRQTIIVASRNIEYDLKNEIYFHYQTLPMEFYKKNNTFKHLKYKAKIDIADYIKEFKNNYENK